MYLRIAMNTRCKFHYKSGSYSGRIDDNYPVNWEKFVYSDTWTPINNSQDTYYTVSGWIYVENVAKNDAQIWLSTRKSGETGWPSGNYSSKTTQRGRWEYLSKTVLVPADVRELNIRIDNNKKGKVWFDDVKIVKGNASQTVIVEESNYYPFGLKHKGYNNVTSSNGNSVAQKFGYNGKEYQEDLGYNMHDFDMRHYDPAIARWSTVDPLAEDMARFSPYNFAFGNPIYYIDPDGMAPYDNYHIYENGNIVREVTNDKTDSFTYVQNDGTKHDVGTFSKNENGLIQVPTVDYKSGDTSVKISTKAGNEDRQFVSGKALASVIGASADSGEEIAIVSASKSDGASPAPSKSHTDGKNMDIRFAGKNGSRDAINYEGSKSNFDKIDTKASATMNASLKKFGYKDIKASRLKVSTTTTNKDGSFTTKTTSHSVPGTKHLKNHYDHQHLQGYNPSIRTHRAPLNIKQRPLNLNY